VDDLVGDKLDPVLGHVLPGAVAIVAAAPVVAMQKTDDAIKDLEYDAGVGFMQVLRLHEWRYSRYTL
jgi:hypothetical protein